MSLFKRKKKLLLKLTTIITCILLTVGCFTTGLVVSADTEKAVVTFEDCYSGSDEIIKYVNDLIIDGERVARKNQNTSKIFANDKVAFCIEPKQGVSYSDELEMDNSPMWEALTKTQKTALKLALMYGYQGNKENIKVSDGELYVATQVIVWEIVSGFRNGTENYECTDNSVFNSVYDESNPTINAGVKQAYDVIDNHLSDYYVMPSFTVKNIDEVIKTEMKWYEEENCFKAELIDENNVISEFNITSEPEDIDILVNDNKLTISTIDENQDIRLIFTRELPTTEYAGSFVLWGSNTKQDLITGLDCKIDTQKSFSEFYTETLTPATEPVTEPITEPITEPTEPITEPTEPITEPTELVTEPTESITESVTKPITEPTEPVTEPATNKPKECSTEKCTLKTTVETVNNTSNTNTSTSTSTTSMLSESATGKVATGDSQTTIIVLGLLLTTSAVTIAIANKLKKSNNAQ